MPQQQPAQPQREQESWMRWGWILWRCFLLIQSVFHLAVFCFLSFHLFIQNSQFYQHSEPVVILNQNETIFNMTDFCLLQKQDVDIDYWIHNWLIGQYVNSFLGVVCAVVLFLFLPSIYHNPLEAMRRAKKTVWVFLLTRLQTGYSVIWLMLGTGVLSLNAIDLCSKVDQWAWFFLFAAVFTQTTICILLAALFYCIPCAFLLFAAMEEGEDFQSQFQLQTRRQPPPPLPIHIQNALEPVAYEDHLSDYAHTSQFCTICQNEFQKEEPVCLMSCFHLFHYQCLLEGLRYDLRCPTCRHWFQFRERKMSIGDLPSLASSSQSTLRPESPSSPLLRH